MHSPPTTPSAEGREHDPLAPVRVPAGRHLLPLLAHPAVRWELTADLVGGVSEAKLVEEAVSWIGVWIGLGTFFSMFALAHQEKYWLIGGWLLATAVTLSTWLISLGRW